MFHSVDCKKTNFEFPLLTTKRKSLSPVFNFQS